MLTGDVIPRWRGLGVDLQAKEKTRAKTQRRKDLGFGVL